MLGPATGGSTRYFFYSSQWQVLDEYVGSTIDRRYVWGLRYVDDLVLRDRGITGTLERLFALQDANWNVVAIYNASANAVAERFAYTAYGVVLPLNPDFSAPYDGTAYDWTVLYTGRALDDESGLYYYRMRYYHPGLGVFVNRDVLGYAEGSNLYRYCDLRPY